MAAFPTNIPSLLKAFDNFYSTLDAATVPVDGGGRRIGGVAHAIAMSEATATLYGELAAAYNAVFSEHGRPLSNPPAGITLMESDSPDGPWSPVKPEHMNVKMTSIGGSGADAVLLAALSSAVEVAAFPASKWNNMQANHPGADHQRWHLGNVISEAQLNALSSAAKLLQLAATKGAKRQERISEYRDKLRRLAESFRELHEQARAEPLIMTRVPNTHEVTLPLNNARFYPLAAEAGALLPDLPDHWRFGIGAEVVAEADPAKRWANGVFNLAAEGLIGVANWDDVNRVECINEPGLASQLVCDLLLNSAKRPNRGRGNLASRIEAAGIRADEIGQRAGDKPSQDAAKLFALTCEAFVAACAIAKMSRKPEVLSASQFVTEQTVLEQCVERAEAIAKGSKAIAQWPTSPGTTFSWKADDSALEVALSFARAILSATLYARSMTVGMLGHNVPDLRVDDPDPNQKVRDWRDATIKELVDHTLQPLPAWPMWEIMRDEQRLGSLLRDESRRATDMANEPTETSNMRPAHLAKGLTREPTDGNGANPDTGTRRFKVAFSFPGECREYVREMDRLIAAQLGDKCVFYDERHEAELARPDLDVYLLNIYHKEADLLVVFEGSDYERKEWTRLEWRAIRQVIKQRQGHRVMFFRLDDGEVSGMFSIDGYIDVRTHSAQQSAALVCERYASGR